MMLTDEFAAEKRRARCGCRRARRWRGTESGSNAEVLRGDRSDDVGQSRRGRCSQRGRAGAETTIVVTRNKSAFASAACSAEAFHTVSGAFSLANGSSRSVWRTDSVHAETVASDLGKIWHFHAKRVVAPRCNGSSSTLKRHAFHATSVAENCLL